MAEKSNKYYSDKQEKLVANALGGYQVGMSGAAPAVPGDVKTYDWLVECKTHTEPGKKIFFDLAVWNKIEDEAMGMSRKPVLIVDDGSQKEDKTWCLCRQSNLNLVGTLTTDFPVAIRKNISCSHDTLTDALKKAAKGVVGPDGFYTRIAYEVEWNNETVVIMTLDTFKELFEK